MNAVHYLNLRESTNVAKYKKKRARELQHDKFRDTAGVVFDRLGDRLEGKGKTILYGIRRSTGVGPDRWPLGKAEQQEG